MSLKDYLNSVFKKFHLNFDKQKAREAISGLREISKKLSLVDGEAIACESREDLEQRYIF
ncbi:hypothetical protein AFK68_16935 [Hydrocoleum sp. CS-953]|nr:hypothetical protein AFK68_16935 [Hydrocoleum sp. CS-953]